MNKLHLDMLLYYVEKGVIKGKLLDAGCGEKPYSLIYDSLVDSSVGVDVEVCIHDQKSVDIFANLDNLPFQDKEFDVVLCTNVMEHVANGKEAFKELSRVLKSDGVLILSIPFLYPMHEAPYDFYRYTKYGIQHMLEENNISIQNIHALGGPGFMFMIYLNLFLCKLKKFRLISFISCWIQEGFYYLYKKLCFNSLINKNKKLNDIITTEFFVIGKKKERS